MPFKKVGKNKNVSPSGRVFTDAQVKLYYATSKKFLADPTRVRFIHLRSIS